MRRGEKIQGRESNQQKSCVDLSLTYSKVHTPCGIQLKDVSVFSGYHEKEKLLPHRVDLESSSAPLFMEQPKRRKIIVDLRPTLREVMYPEEEQINCSTKSSEELFFVSTECSEKPQKAIEREKPVTPCNRTTGEVRICLPSIQNNCVKSKASPMGHQVVSLVAVRDDGILSCNSEDKSFETQQMCFPKIILSQRQLQKIPDEPRTPKNVDTGWHGVEKLQLPLSELVRVAKERADSGHHTLINHVLCSLREKRLHNTIQANVLMEKMCQENTHRSQKIPCSGGNIRLTWAKRS
ncbi:Hypothetical predicted protein [Pelobates cultripes]|uniref:Uncharacterized protein n=2 Tax=Pelobates cultripes TaxID=61616 RepID=A0AAD1W8C8_PELCU|nr:Hypothetical predicted protein [Pelobates cultripes]